jgi:carbonic anhydrase/acetyltransferase-like protein (isoleucine patch superfamily)
MSQSAEVTSQSYQGIFENQGIDPGTVGPDDYFLTRRSFLSGIDVEGHGEWYAIPRRLSVENPFTGEIEAGTLRENGAFISDASEIAGYRVKIGSRVVVLGASKIEDARIRTGAVVHAADVSDADVGRNTVINEGANVRGTPQSFEGGRGRIQPAFIEQDVVVGARASVSGESHLSPNCEIGADVVVTHSYLGEGVVVAAANPEDASLMRDQFRGKWTVVARSDIGPMATIGANAQIEKSKIGPRVEIGERSDLENVTVDRGEVIPAGTTMRVKEEPQGVTSKSGRASGPSGTSLAQKLRARIPGLV